MELFHFRSVLEAFAYSLPRLNYQSAQLLLCSLRLSSHRLSPHHICKFVPTQRRKYLLVRSVRTRLFNSDEKLAKYAKNFLLRMRRTKS